MMNQAGDAPSLFFHRALKRVLVTRGKVHHQRNLGFRNLMAEHANNREALFMHGHHDLDRLIMGQAKEAFQQVHNKFHRRVIVVQDHHLIQRWPFGLGPCFKLDSDIIIVVIVPISHHVNVLEHCIPLARVTGRVCVSGLNITFMAPMKRGHAYVTHKTGQEHPLSNKNWTIAFDADDTLWHNERGIKLTQNRFSDLLADFTSGDDLQDRLLSAERRNLGIYGFGVKGFVLSMVETSIEVTDCAVPTAVIAELLMGRDMLSDPVEMLTGVGSAIEKLRQTAEIVLITKGDLLVQDCKLAQSGLGDLFDAVEIVSDKTTDVYARIFARHDTAHQMMVGNSVRSDVIPAIEAGAWGVHVPHELTLAYEHVVAPITHRRFREVATLGELPELVATLN